MRYYSGTKSFAKMSRIVTYIMFVRHNAIPKFSVYETYHYYELFSQKTRTFLQHFYDFMSLCESFYAFKNRAIPEVDVENSLK